MEEQIRLELNISSLIWENWTNQKRSKSTSCALLYLVISCRLPVPASTSAYLVLYVCVFEHQGQRSDVLPVHPIAASDLDGVFDAFVNLLGSGMPYIGHRAVRKRGQDLLVKNMVVSDQSGGSR